MNRNYPPPEAAEIVRRDAAAGIGHTRTAEQLGVCRHTVLRWRGWLGVRPARGKGEPKPWPVERMAAMRAQGASYADIGREVGAAPNTVRAHLRRHQAGGHG